MPIDIGTYAVDPASGLLKELQFVDTNEYKEQPAASDIQRSEETSGAGLRQIPNAALALWLDPTTETTKPGSILRADSQ